MTLPPDPDGVGRWQDARGLVWVHRILPTTRDVLDVEVRLTHEIKAARVAQRAPSSAGIAQLGAWLTRCTLDVEGLVDEDGQGWAAWPASVRRDAVERLLDLTDWLLYYRAILDACALPDDTLEGMGQVFELLLDGGCDCRVCAGAAPPQPRFLAHCAHERHGAHLYHLAGLYLPVRDEPVMDQPYWMHQLRSAWLAAQGRLARDKQDTQDEKRRVADRLRAKGIA